ncbi:PREDICTED: leucine-rich repeat serine/threonine-protein kinase 1 isoform X1 [Capra hircus]|uniref:Leucine-rich repeat serine/threonine-protein kinase 1 n=1 Tax=Capra hircus TaxID=9925 RepID=A0A452FW19_CAPHI|nr:PREDICTED: leucine-rich repeat serine/threonine-protein kinase 1 isoform X1 [Capra hircus]XP_017921791.1 PREDICTED: leucine-rich repeat serine/threonine-protein kinase 1 isoform X1 [Capra hircus]XP_017921792.1 PREDICTED: leucine-rich repeat serine/threonine-protein kinase 1 isoform X1 [Capra hircus]
MAGMSRLPPSMYWCVGPAGSAVCPGRAMETQENGPGLPVESQGSTTPQSGWASRHAQGAGDMGSKLSMPGGEPIVQSLRTEGIHAAYRRGDVSRAQHLLREACDESTSQLEKSQLLSISAAHGDLETVRYLLTERLVELRTEPTDDNPAVVAAQFGHTDVVQELLESLPGPCSPQRLLNWMLALACQQGHLAVVKLLVLTYGADPESYAVRKNEFPVIVRLPLYAAIKSGNEDIAIFLIRHGAFFCSYILLDSPDPSKHLLRKYFVEASALPSSCPGKMALRVKWSHLKLPWVDLDWLIDISCQITELDLSANCLASLPSVVPWGLINLRKLNLSDNHLGELPSVQSSDEIICSRLLEIDISSNKLSHLPPGFLHLSKLQKLTASKNYLETLFEEESATNWIGLRKLQELDVSDNKLTELPALFLHSFKSLSCLNVSRNNLKAFPDAWACPLKCCKASKNALEFLPDKMAVFWKNHLKDVDFSENALKEVPLGLFQLDALMFLKLQGNQLVALPPQEKWTCRQLKTLDLSRNHFGKNEDILKTKRISFFTTRGRQRSGTEAVCVLEFPAFLSESLEVLCLNDNHLDAVPPSVCLLKSLSELYLGNNPSLRELPPELGQLGNLWQLDIEDLNISNVPAEIRKEGPKAMLSYLRAQLRKAEKCKQLKMIIVGPPRQGKSTLLEILQTGRAPQVVHSEATIRTTKWELQRPAGSRAKVESVEFTVWDIGGPASMATVNQCFFTDKALYVVVWNLALGEEAVASLQFWLLNIEAKAPNAVVLVVGTHLDLIETKFRVERIATLRAYVLALCRSPSGSRATGFPDITCKHLHELSCKSLEGQEGLRQLIFQVTCNMKDVGSTIGCQRLAGRLIPRSYLSLQEAVLAEQQRRSLSDDVQYLTDRQLEQLVDQMPGSDIRDYEDLQSAISFLIETGSLLHFPDTSHGLRNLYFLDPIWLSECLQRIFNIKGSRSVAKNGVIRAEDLRLLLVGTGFTKQTEEQYFQFLAKFEIALPVANDSYLLPHLLPSKPGLDTHGMRHPTANTIQRVFKMSFVPVGFWQRFIARMLISLAEMDLQLFENRKNTKSRHRRVTIYSFTGNQRNRCSTFRVKRNQTIYWQEGLLVTFDGGYLSVESSDVNWKKKKSGGIKIMCQSEIRDFSAMAFITDHVNSLIDQWFPALTATESDGTPLMEQYVPCPVCEASWAQHSNPSERSEDVQYFDMEDCVLTAIERDFISCPRHPDLLVPLQELVPELFMTDFPARLFLENSKLEHSEDESAVLGQGGSGTVIYRARYQGQPVAVKRFQIKKFKNFANAPADTMLRRLQATDAMRSFSEFRQEASMLHALQHPCIVSLIGISVHPLCFALELAPLGSLNTVLSENARDSSFMPLGHMLTQKIAYQIASGLAYLHKKNIIFCDLKSDNILVWSLDIKEHINIKLSDYGISRQSFHEGALGVEGTPGYQAPEIRPRIVYDEKVDMFSYGMVLYELLSGQRPALGQHQLQIAKKLSKGIRPVLGQPEEVQFHRLQALMMECWDTKPEKRPLALAVVSQMKDPTFATFMYQLPCGKQTSFFSSQGQEYMVVFWEGKEESRNYTVVNTEKGLLEVQHMSCAGMKLSCQLKIQNSLWTATEDQKIYIYSLKGMCPLNTPQRALDTPAIVTCFLAVPIIKKNSHLVLAGLADGLVAVFPAAWGAPDYGCSYLCSHTANRAKFSIPDEDARQNPYPVTAMEVVNSGSEVWYSNGPGLLVIDCAALEIRRRLEPYVAPSVVTSVVCGSECRGEEVVWCLDDRANCLVLYHSATYQLCARYFCGDPSPLGDVFPVGPMGPPPLDSPAASPREPARGSIADVSFMFSEELGTQILSHQDSLTDYCSLSSCSAASPHPAPTALSSLPCSPASSASLPFSADCEDTSQLPEPAVGSNRSAHDLSPVDGEAFSQHLQAVKILAVKDVIWVPRRGGDIIVIGLEKEAGTQRGRVIAVLKARELTPHGILTDAAVVAKDTVVCGFENENLEWCLAVWRGWGMQEFDIFYQSYEELGRLEAYVRKRR